MRFDDFKKFREGVRRREAVRTYLLEHQGLTVRVAARAGVHRTVVSKVLHGRAVSARVEQAIEDEEAAVRAA